MRRLILSGLAIASAAVSGCYSLVPVGGASPAPGTRIALDVNDAGRAALGGAIGPEVDRVEGQLIEQTGGEYLLGVTSVSLLRGGTQTWKGERVVVKPEFVSNVYERRFDVARTGLAAAAVTAGVAFIVTQDLLGGGNEDAGSQGPDSLNTRRNPAHRITLLSVPLSKIVFFGRP